MSNNHFIFDKNKCVGCEACVLACVNENGFQSPLQWRTISASNTLKTPGLPLFYFSMACNHCEDAPCMKYCPALAFKRSEQTGAVLHIENNCIGCKYCTWQCPYDAPKFNPIKGTVEKCTFCESRLIDGQKPACASLCPTEALDFSQKPIDKSIIMPDLEINRYPKPSIVIKELVKESGPRIDNSLFEGEEFIAIEPKKESKINARKEWPLLVFTLIISVFSGMMAAGHPSTDVMYSRELFLAVGFTGAILSMLHLGRKERMWRSVLNIRHSWLSREILFFGIFMTATVIHFYVYSLPIWVFVVVGLLLCISVDMLYQAAHWKWKLKIHSAQAIFIAASVFLILKHQEWLFSIVMGARLVLFVYRKLDMWGKWQAITNVARISSSALAVALLFLDYPMWLVWLFFLIGEIIDRVSYYNELSVPEPSELIKTH